MKSSSLKVSIWLYLIGFTLLIFILLWGFQLTLLTSFYEYTKENEAIEVSNLILESYNEYDFINKESLDLISYEKNVCIEVIRNDNIIYTSNYLYRGCISDTNYKNEFYQSEDENHFYKITNNKTRDSNLVYASKIEDVFIFINAPLDPLDSTTSALSSQLMIVSVLVIILALTIGYYISIVISKPIEDMNYKARLLSKGNFKFNFSGSNIKEINELAETLNTAKLELEKTESLRNDLLANVSHDLKTPLTMIKGYAEMIKDFNYKNKDKMFENLDVIIEETNRLNSLVEDILDLSKGNLKEELNKEEFYIDELVIKVLNRFSIYKNEGYIFECNLDKSLIIADKKQIEQVLYNLISNAINYTGKDNKVIINIKNDINIKVEIIDSGKGIKDSEVNYIWNKYYHSDKKHKRNKIGTGLGLFIVKSILEKHGFNYGVISKKNKGSNFYFEIKDK